MWKAFKAILSSSFGTLTWKYGTNLLHYKWEHFVLRSIIFLIHSSVSNYFLSYISFCYYFFIMWLWCRVWVDCGVVWESIWKFTWYGWVGKCFTSWSWWLVDISMFVWDSVREYSKWIILVVCHLACLQICSVKIFVCLGACDNRRCHLEHRLLRFMARQEFEYAI